MSLTKDYLIISKKKFAVKNVYCSTLFIYIFSLVKLYFSITKLKAFKSLFLSNAFALKNRGLNFINSLWNDELLLDHFICDIFFVQPDQICKQNAEETFIDLFITSLPHLKRNWKQNGKTHAKSIYISDAYTFGLGELIYILQCKPSY